MKRLLFILTGMLFTGALHAQITVDLKNRPYDQIAWVHSHNATSNKPMELIAPEIARLVEQRFSGIFGLVALLYDAQTAEKIKKELKAVSKAIMNELGKAIKIHDQDVSLEQQLADGIRSMKIPVWRDGGAINACHGSDSKRLMSIIRDADKGVLGGALNLEKNVNALYKFLYGKDMLTDPNFSPCWMDPGRVAASDVLQTIKKFLDNNPQEVFTLFLETYVPINTLEKLITDAGLMSIIHVQQFGQSWPTLGEMVKNNKRLVLFINKSGGDWYNDSKKFFYGTQWYFKTIDELRANDGSKPAHFLTRKAPNKMFSPTHTVTPTAAGDRSKAAQVNKKDFLLPRMQKYINAGHYPTHISLDFYDAPSKTAVFDAVNEINAILGEKFKQSASQSFEQRMMQ